MIVTLVVACEVGFWVLLAAGLLFRYALRMPRTGAGLLLCEPVLELVLFAATAVDLRGGATPGWQHGLAAVYIGFTVALGHSTVRWVDERVRHRWFDGPPPVRPPKYGMPRAVHEWKVAARWLLACAIAAGLLQAAVWYVGGGDTSTLRAWQQKAYFVAGLNVLIALTYTVFPKRAPGRG